MSSLDCSQCPDFFPECGDYTKMCECFLWTHSRRTFRFHSELFFRFAMTRGCRHCVRAGRTDQHEKHQLLRPRRIRHIWLGQVPGIFFNWRWNLRGNRLLVIDCPSYRPVVRMLEAISCFCAPKLVLSGGGYLYTSCALNWC